MGPRSARIKLTVVLATVAAVAVWAASAGAGTPTQIGMTGIPDSAEDCLTGNWLQESSATAPSYTVPSDGVITSWSHRAQASAPGKGGLQVWRPAGGTSYTLVGASDIKTFTAGTLHTFPINLPVSAGDVLGFRAEAGPGCVLDSAGFGTDITRLSTTGNPLPGTTVAFPFSGEPVLLNVSATFDPADPAPPPGPTGLDSSATKGKQSANKLKIKLTTDQDSTLDVGGKGKIAQRGPASSSAKSKNYALKKKQGVALQAGVEQTIRLKFKNNSKTLRQIKKLQKRSKKARKRSKVVANLTVTSAAGVATDSKLKIKLKP